MVRKEKLYCGDLLHIMCHYTQENYDARRLGMERFLELNEKLFETYIVSRELGKITKGPHLQGFIRLKVAMVEKKRKVLGDDLKVQLGVEGTRNTFCLSFWAEGDKSIAYLVKDADPKSIEFRHNITDEYIQEERKKWVSAEEYKKVKLQNNTKSYSEKVLDYVIKDYDTLIEKSRPLKPCVLSDYDKLEVWVIKKILEFYDISRKPFGPRLVADLSNYILNHLEEKKFQNHFVQQVLDIRHKSFQ